MTVTADSNPGKRNYAWKSTTSNDSIAITERMIGYQSLRAVVCNTIPIPSAHTVCSDFPVNVVVISKCVLIIFLLVKFEVNEDVSRIVTSSMEKCFKVC